MEIFIVGFQMTSRWQCLGPRIIHRELCERLPFINRFANKAAILISIVSKDIVGCSADMYLHPEHPIIAI